MTESNYSTEVTENQEIGNDGHGLAESGLTVPVSFVVQPGESSALVASEGSQSVNQQRGGGSLRVSGGAPLAAPPPPYCITGVKVTECIEEKQSQVTGIHWVRWSFPCEKYDEALSLVKRYSEGDSFRDSGLWGYEASLVWLNGARLIFDESPKARRSHNGLAVLEIPGEVFDGLTFEQVKSLLAGLVGLGGRCKRVDVYLDDFQRVVTIDRLRKAVKRGEVVGFAHSETRQGRRVGGLLQRDEISFGRRGSKGSGKYLRVYDKGLESKGKRDCLRWEVEFTDNRAEVAFGKLYECGDSVTLGGMCHGLVAGVVDFRAVAAGQDRHLARRGRFTWWSKLLKGVVVFRVRVAKVVQRATRAMRWTERQVAVTLAALREGMGGKRFASWLTETVAGSRPRMGKRHRDMVQELRYAVCGGA